ncbi:MAG: SDR family NAD(P)-dependent oxidoreductase [Bacteroidota bacterium]
MSLSFLPRPDFLEFTLPESHIVLLTNEGTTFSEKAYDKLQAEGLNPVLWNLPGTTSSNRNAIELPSISDEAIAQSLALAQKQYGPIGSFIHLHPHLEFQNGQFAQHFQKEKELLKLVYLSAKHLQKPLTELGQTQRSNFLTISRLDGHLGLGKRGNTSILGGGLCGMVKCLNLEWPSVFCRAVDLQPELAIDAMVEHVWAEFHGANLNIQEVGISEKGRQTIAATEIKLEDNQSIETNVTSDTVFLVSGGARGITATCVLEMARAFQCKFILLGRSSNDYILPDFAKANHDDATLKRLIMEDLKAKGEKASLPAVKAQFKSIIAKKEIQETLDQIQNFGGQARYVQADVTNAQQTKTNIASAVDQLGKITGLLHGAGRLADKLIQNKTETDFENVLSVKLDGLLTLLQCVEIQHLDHLILFSSVAGFYGNVGQTDYSMANEILSKAAHLFKTNHPNTQVSAINWGAWDAGMVSPELKKKFEEAGVTLVNSAGGAAMLINELNTAYAEQAQVIIGGTLPMAISHHYEDLKTWRIHRQLRLEDNAFLMHHVIQEKAVLPVVNAVGWMAQTCEYLYPDFQIFEVKNTKLFKGLVFDGTQREQYITEAKEIEKDKESITFEATILSEGSKLPTYHYNATIVLRHRNALPTAPRFEAQLSGTYTATDGAVLYQNGALFHDHYFRGIEKVLDWNEEQIVLACKAPTVPKTAQGQFPTKTVNTFFTDIQYQGMVIWVQRYNDGAKSLPLQTDAAIIYEAIPFEKELFVHVKIVESSPFKMIADCTVYDATGKVYMFTKNAAVTVSKTLNW